MRKIIVTEFLSLDGVMEEPGDWHFPYFLGDPGPGAEKVAELVNADALLVGRKTYEIFAGAWPDRGRDMANEAEPTDPESETFFQDKFNWMPKHVVSDTLTDPQWNNTHVIRGSELEQAINDLKASEGRDIYIHGSGKLIESLMPLGVIDEVRLMVHPVVVGSGQRLFPEGLGESYFDLVEAKPFEKGIVLLVYRKGEKPEMPEFDGI